MSATLFGGGRLLLYVKVAMAPVEPSRGLEVSIPKLPGDACQDVFHLIGQGGRPNPPQRRTPRRFFTCFSEL